MEPPAHALFVEGDDIVRVVGTSHYQPALLAAAGAADGDEVRHETVAALVPEPDNPHDPHAVAVQIDAQTVGYLARDEHPRWRELLETVTAAGRVLTCEAMIAGREGMVGLFLRLPTPTEARAQVALAIRGEPGSGAPS